MNRACDAVQLAARCQPGAQPRLSWPSDVAGNIGPGWCPRCGRVQGHACNHPERAERDEALLRRDAKAAVTK